MLRCQTLANSGKKSEQPDAMWHQQHSYSSLTAQYSLNVSFFIFMHSMGVSKGWWLNFEHSFVSLNCSKNFSDSKCIACTRGRGPDGLPPRISQSVQSRDQSKQHSPPLQPAVMRGMECCMAHLCEWRSQGIPHIFLSFHHFFSFFFLFNEITDFSAALIFQLPWIRWKVLISFPLFFHYLFVSLDLLLLSVCCLLSLVFFSSSKYTPHHMTFCFWLKNISLLPLHLYPILSKGKTWLFPLTYGFFAWLYFVIFLHSSPTSFFSMLLHFIHTLPPPYVSHSSCHFSNVEENNALPLQRL